MESLLRVGAGVHRRAWTVRSSKGRAARSSVCCRRRDARSPVRASTHGFQQFAGNAIWRREAGTASRSRARRHAVAGVATLSAAQHRAGAVGADNDASAAAQRERSAVPFPLNMRFLLALRAIFFVLLYREWRAATCAIA